MGRVLSMDPGINGGAAITEIAGCRLIDVIDLPTLADGEGKRREIDAWRLMCWALHFEATEAIVENVQPMPSREEDDGDGGRTERRGMGAVSAFRFGAGVFGARAALRCAKLPIFQVVPRVWKKHFDLGGGETSKEAARHLAIQLYPEQSEMFQRVKDHQRAEAVLIGRWRIEKMGML